MREGENDEDPVHERHPRASHRASPPPGDGGAERSPARRRAADDRRSRDAVPRQSPRGPLLGRRRQAPVHPDPRRTPPVPRVRGVGSAVGRSARDRASAGPGGPADRPHGVTRTIFRRPPRSTAIPSLGRPPIHSPIRRTSVMRIVVARAPGRVSLAGGGTDLPSYYERHGGAVVSFAISSGST